MPHSQLSAELTLVNGSTGDPVLYVDYPDADNAILFDAGENCRLPMERLADLRAVFITHHHVDHFIGLDRIVRANIDNDKVLSIFGPPGTIQKVYDRIRSYEYQFFPFQKIVIDVVDVKRESLLRARLECTKRFPPPMPVAEARTSAEIFRTDLVRVEAAFAEHTVPCLSYALVEEPGYHFDSSMLESGALRPGPWIRDVGRKLRENARLDEEVAIQDGKFTLGSLAKTYFGKTAGGRLAFITDTIWTDAVAGDLVKLASKADRLYCDSYYASAQDAAAQKHKHMTATAAAELAQRAHVRELVLMHFGPRYQGRYEALLDEARAVFPRTSAEIV
jgi:ribonuclease Z